MRRNQSTSITRTNAYEEKFVGTIDPGVNI